MFKFNKKLKINNTKDFNKKFNKLLKNSLEKKKENLFFKIQKNIYKKINYYLLILKH